MLQGPPRGDGPRGAIEGVAGSGVLTYTAKYGSSWREGYSARSLVLTLPFTLVALISSQLPHHSDRLILVPFVSRRGLVL